MAADPTPESAPIRVGEAENGRARGSDWVALQFDDRVFTLSRSTLSGEPDSLFAALFAQDSVSAATLDRNFAHPLKPVVFDRNPRYVEPLLQYLRTGEVGVADDADAATFRAVYLEACYFGVSGAMEQLAELCPDCTKTAVERRRERVSRPDAPTMTRTEVEKILMAAPATPTGNALYRLRWCGIRFTGVDFTDLHLAAIDFERCEFRQCVFHRCNLTRSNLSDCEIEGGQFAEANLSEVRCTGTIAQHCNFSRANCDGADFSRCILVGADFSSAMLTNCNFESSDLSEAKLAGADLSRAKLQRTVLRGVERQGTSLSMGGVIANSPNESTVTRAGNAFMRAVGVGRDDM